MSAQSFKSGQSLSPLALGEMTKETIAEYSRVSKDPNPMHVDEELAKAAGYPTVYAQGMLGMAYLARHLTGVCGVGKLKRIKVRFKTLTWPGEQITCRARVTEINKQGKSDWVTCEIQTENESGEPKVIGTATFEA
jgi:acyl dehydratase